MRPLLYFTALVFTLTTCAQAQTQENYSRAKIYFDANGHSMMALSALGLAVDHGQYKKNTFFISDFSQREINKARQAGFKVEILIPDVVKYYQEQNKKKATGSAERTTSVTCEPQLQTVPSHFHLGSYGGFFTFTEMLQILDSMQLLYPGLISVRQPIDTFESVLDSPIYWVRISNNPSVDQPAKPQMLYTSVHHAREPGSLSSVIYYLWYLLENYSTDPHVKTLIDNTELYFIPCVNPDGYLYNITTNPLGGGLWRKNMRTNPDGTTGVDLNRNYGMEWGYDNIGSSPNGIDDTYRGTSAFSEPETQAVEWFINNHHFTFALNFHTYNNDILYPWNYLQATLTNDSAFFFNYAQYVTQPNHYRYGTCYQTLNYTANGDSDDWMYGDSTSKPKMFSLTPEVGILMNGFYPPATQIIPDCQNTLSMCLNTASLLLPFATIQHTDKRILPQSGYLHYSLQRLGFPDTATFTVSILPLDSRLTVSSTPKVYTGLAMLQTITDSMSYSLNAATPNNQSISYVLQLYNGTYYMYDTVQFYFGKYMTSYDPSTSSLDQWINMGWGVCTTSYYIPPSSIQSSLNGEENYPDDADITVTTADTIDLTNALNAYLQFYTHWAIETDYDYVNVNSIDVATGISEPLCGLYTRDQPFTGSSLPVYDGQQPYWVREEMNLADYLGSKIQIQYELVSDPSINDKGFFFDVPDITKVMDSSLTAVPKINTHTLALAAYPNPAHDELTLSVTGYAISQPLDARMYDCTGREVKHFTISQPQYSVNVSQLAAGVYFLKARNDQSMLPVIKVDVVR